MADLKTTIDGMRKFAAELRQAADKMDADEPQKLAAEVKAAKGLAALKLATQTKTTA